MLVRKENKKVMFISEVLSTPFDEGIKNVAFSVHSNLKNKAELLTVTLSKNSMDGMDVRKLRLNKLFFNRELKKLIDDYVPDVIIYLPEASLTFNSFIRARILKGMIKTATVAVLGVKHVAYSQFHKRLITKLLKPDLLLLLGRFDMDFFNAAGARVRSLPPAVDTTKFCRVSKEEKHRIRSEFGILETQKIVLHVGHIRATRNVESLTAIQEIENVQVVVVGSTSTVVERELKGRIERKGVRVIDDYVPDISKVYKMSDIYVFQVVDEIACIEMPLSVFEAMACGLPVFTTRFGGLEELLKEDEGFRYFDTIEELMNMVRDFNGTDAAYNFQKVKDYTWDRLTDEIMAAVNEVI